MDAERSAALDRIGAALAGRPKRFNPHSCIACDKEREAGSGFCPEHKVVHEKSEWVKNFRKEMRAAK